MKKAFLFAFAVLFLASCDNKIGLPPVTVPAPVTPGACDTVTYTKQIQTLLNNNCVSCHNSSFSSGSVDLSTYTLAKAKALDGRIKVRAIDNSDVKGPMPQGGLMPQADLDLLQCWINNGAIQ